MEDTTQQKKTTEELILLILRVQKKQTDAIISIKKNVQFFSWLTIVGIVMYGFIYLLVFMGFF